MLGDFHARLAGGVHDILHSAAAVHRFGEEAVLFEVLGEGQGAGPAAAPGAAHVAEEDLKERAGGAVADFKGGGLEKDDVGGDGGEGVDGAAPVDEMVLVVNGLAVPVDDEAECWQKGMREKRERKREDTDCHNRGGSSLGGYAICL